MALLEINPLNIYCSLRLQSSCRRYRAKLLIPLLLELPVGIVFLSECLTACKFTCHAERVSFVSQSYLRLNNDCHSCYYNSISSAVGD